MGSIFDDVTKTKIMDDTAEVLKTKVLKKGKKLTNFFAWNAWKSNQIKFSQLELLGNTQKIYANRPLCNIVRLGRGQGLWAPHSSSSQSYKFSLTSQVDIQK